MFHIHRQTSLRHNNVEGLPEWVFWIARTRPCSRTLSWARYMVLPTLAELYGCGCSPGQAFIDIPHSTIFHLLKTIGTCCDVEGQLDVPC